MDDVRKLEALDEQAGQDITEGVGGMLSRFPTEPIDAATYNGFAETVETAIEVFGAGQVEAEQDINATGDIKPGGIDPVLGRNVMALALAFDKFPEGEPYRFRPEDAFGTAVSMDEVGATIMAATQDQKLVAAMTSPSGEGAPPPEKTPPAASAPKKPQAEDFMGGEG